MGWRLRLMTSRSTLPGKIVSAVGDGWVWGVGCRVGGQKAAGEVAGRRQPLPPLMLRLHALRQPRYWVGQEVALYGIYVHMQPACKRRCKRQMQCCSRGVPGRAGGSLHLPLPAKTKV